MNFHNNNSESGNNHYFLNGSDQMSTTLRQTDWSQHVLGVPENWSISLRNAVAMVLSSKFPMILWWGSELIQFHNDASVPRLSGIGKMQEAGKPADDNWSGTWHLTGPVIQKVMQSGEAVNFQDQPVSFTEGENEKEAQFFCFSYSPLFGDTGKVEGVLGICADISAAKQSEQQIRSLVDSAPFPIGVYEGRNMRIAMANQAIIDVWGKGSDIIGKTYFDALPELENQDIYPRLLEVYSEGRPFNARNQRVDLMVQGNLQPFYFNYSFTPLFNQEGQVYGVLNTAADVTDLNLAKIKVEQTQQDFKNLILQAPVCMCLLLGPSHTVEVANDCMINLWGKEERDVMNRPIFEALPDAKEQGLEALLDHVYKTGETFTANEMPVHLIRFGNPDIVYQNFIYEPYRDASGEILGVIAISNDVTKQVLAMRRIEEIVQQRTQQLESANESLSRSNSQLAEFAYIASHDLQEPLRKISIFSQMLESKVGGSLDAKSQGQLKKIKESSERMQALVKDVLAYSQLNNAGGEIASVDLNKIVEGILSDMELLIEQKEAVIAVGRLPIVPGQTLQLTQLLSNLIGNSLKFHRPGSVPQISVEAFEVPDQEKTVLSLDAAVDFVKIVVSDKGIGFKEEQADKIFELFQRLHSKTEFEGTGIGLSICMKIVENHHGLITAQGSSENGARFNIYLPLKRTQ